MDVLEQPFSEKEEPPVQTESDDLAEEDASLEEDSSEADPTPYLPNLEKDFS